MGRADAFHRLAKSACFVAALYLSHSGPRDHASEKANSASSVRNSGGVRLVDDAIPIDHQKICALRKSARVREHRNLPAAEIMGLTPAHQTGWPPHNHPPGRSAEPLASAGSTDPRLLAHAFTPATRFFNFCRAAQRAVWPRPQSGAKESPSARGRGRPGHVLGALHVATLHLDELLRGLRGGRSRSWRVHRR